MDAICQRRRAVLKPPVWPIRKTTALARPDRAAKSSLRVATKSGAAKAPIAPPTAPDFRASSSAQSA